MKTDFPSERTSHGNLTLTSYLLGNDQMHEKCSGSPRPAGLVRPSLIALLLGICLLAVPVRGDSADQSQASGQSQISASVVELATDALPLWRDTPDHEKRTLLIFSNDPFLQPIPAALQDAARHLAAEGSEVQLQEAGRYFRPSPVLLPSQAVTAALELDMFSRLVWVIPTRTVLNGKSLELLKGQLAESGIMTAEESSELILKDQMIHGRLRGHPFILTTPDNLPEINQRVWLHVDLSFIQSLYKNEVSTPIYPLLRNLATTVLSAKLDLAGATISLSTAEEGMVKMSMRFAGRTLANFLATGEGVNGAARPEETMHSRALYLTDMMANDKAMAELEEAFKQNPEDTGILYSYYQALRAQKRGTEALHILALATRQDPGYGYEYLYLAGDAMEKNRPDASLDMLKKAQRIFPGNHYIPMKILERFIDLGQLGQAKKQLTKLQGMPWSDIYYPDMPEILGDYQTLIDELAEEKPSE